MLLFIAFEIKLHPSRTIFLIFVLDITCANPSKNYVLKLTLNSINSSMNVW